MEGGVSSRPVIVDGLALIPSLSASDRAEDSARYNNTGRCSVACLPGRQVRRPSGVCKEALREEVRVLGKQLLRSGTSVAAQVERPPVRARTRSSCPSSGVPCKERILRADRHLHDHDQPNPASLISAFRFPLAAFRLPLTAYRLPLALCSLHVRPRPSSASVPHLPSPACRSAVTPPSTCVKSEDRQF
jgi:hypothetical protein